MAARKDKDHRRAEFGQAAQRALLNRGLEGLRLRDVAEAAGVTSAAILYHYGDLDELMADTYRHAIDRFCSSREERAERFPDARERLRSCIESGVADGPDDLLPRLLFEYSPRSLRDPQAAALEATLVERQVAVYYGVLVLGREQGHFTCAESLRILARNFVALEDGYQMDILTRRRPRVEVIDALRSYAETVTGCTLR
ncbi:MAG: Transcriptional regulator, TetR family [Nocardia sp.]|uniref:TetR/AcrR family transcriptional regulator n=1 Tax=Nocardia sp. TaxID=1821 RepID=UPI0026186E32|nr:TetR/AcrR family transcriptional regulator [Nocardia sp.]MCU1642546.1 Transcriptional regulator, TetR family [Nocardia sp.]